jgi:hypothetical protein
MGAFDPRWMGPAACLVVGVIMFLAVVLFSIRRR